MKILRVITAVPFIMGVIIVYIVTFVFFCAVRFAKDMRKEYFGA